jgi:hypothetical protein
MKLDHEFSAVPRKSPNARRPDVRRVTIHLDERL